MKDSVNFLSLSLDVDIDRYRYIIKDFTEET